MARILQRQGRINQQKEAYTMIQETKRKHTKSNFQVAMEDKVYKMLVCNRMNQVKLTNTEVNMTLSIISKVVKSQINLETVKPKEVNNHQLQDNKIILISNKILSKKVLCIKHKDMI